MARLTNHSLAAIHCSFGNQRDVIGIVQLRELPQQFG
jgi:hypothetical protein